jgi:hypothetical protein
VLLGLAICAGFAVILLLMGWLSAESRPDFLDPTVKHAKFVAPIRSEDL